MWWKNFKFEILLKIKLNQIKVWIFQEGADEWMGKIFFCLQSFNFGMVGIFIQFSLSDILSEIYGIFIELKITFISLKNESCHFKTFYVNGAPLLDHQLGQETWADDFYAKWFK